MPALVAPRLLGPLPVQLDPAQPSFHPAACAWEWGGVAEVEPAPCADVYLSRLAGAGLTLAGFGIVFSLVLLAAVVAISLRLRHA